MSRLWLKVSLACFLSTLSSVVFANQVLVLSHDGLSFRKVQIGQHKQCYLTGLSFLSDRRAPRVPVELKQLDELWELHFEKYVTGFTVEVRCNSDK